MSLAAASMPVRVSSGSRESLEGTPGYDRAALAIAAGGDTMLLSPGGTTLVHMLSGRGENAENVGPAPTEDNLSRKLTFSKVRSGAERS